MIKQFTLSEIFFTYKRPVIGTFLLLVLENSLMLFTPFLLGLAIDRLIRNDFSGAVWLGIIYFAAIVVGMLRRLYDTRVYSKIYAELATHTVDIHHEKDAPQSTIVARANLMQELIQFFEQELTTGFSLVIKVMGAVLMLFYFKWQLGVACLIAMFFVWIIYYISRSNIFSLNSGLNDELEKQVDIIATKDSNGVAGHFDRLARWWIKLSDLESINFSFLGLVLLVLIIFSLFVTVEKGMTSGSIFAVLAYVLEFSEGIYLLPVIYQQFVRLEEISERLNSVK